MGRMMRLLKFESGAWGVAEALEPQQARALAYSPVQTWIRLEGEAADKLDSLGAVFDLHPLAIEDVRNPRQRPKVEDYPNLTFVVARAPRWDGDDELLWQNVGIFLGPDFILTCSPEPVTELDQVERRLLTQRPGPRTGTVDNVLYQVVDTLVDAYFPVMEGLEDRIEAIETGVVEGADKYELAQIQDLKHAVSRMRKTIYPMREAMVGLERGEHPNITQDTRLYLRDVADHTTRLAERLEHVQELAVLAQETYNATLANQTNTVVKRLAGITFVLTIPMLVASIFGMNFGDYPMWGPWIPAFVVTATMLPSYLLARKWDWL